MFGFSFRVCVYACVDSAFRSCHVDKMQHRLWTKLARIELPQQVDRFLPRFVRKFLFSSRNNIGLRTHCNDVHMIDQSSMKSTSKNCQAQSKREMRKQFDRCACCSFNLRRIILLEFSQYLENFLWPNLNPDQVNMIFD